MLPALLLAALFAGQDIRSDEAARKAVGRSLAYLEKAGVEWMENRRCVSCHTVGMMVWTHNEARRRGFPVPAEKTRAWTDWSLVDVLTRGKDSAADMISQVILARHSGDSWRGKPALQNKTADPYEVLWDWIIDRQQPDGSWKPGPNLGYPPEVSTRWAFLALSSRDSGPEQGAVGAVAELMKKLDSRIPESLKSAASFLKEATPDDSLEARILRLLMMRKQEPALAQIWLLELLDLQNADGGWSYLKGASESDVFATGLALYTCGVQGHPKDNVQVTRAREFLLRSMKSDGSWFVKTASLRPVKEGEKTTGADAIYSYWGTAWATLGLLWTLPESAISVRTGVRE